MKLPEDRVGDFFRSEIDRGLEAYSHFINQRSQRLIQVTLSALQYRRELGVLDGGCGTGRALWDLRTQLLLRSRIDPVRYKLTMVGINDVDYSQESELAAVRRSIADREIDYRVDDLEKVDFADQKFDFILLFEVLIHNRPEKVVRIWQNLLPSLCPGGVLHGDLGPDQVKRQEIVKYLAKLKADGYVVYQRDNIYFRGEGRTFLLIERAEAGIR